MANAEDYFDLSPEKRRNFDIKAAEYHIRRAHGEEIEPPDASIGDGDGGQVGSYQHKMHHLGHAIMIARINKLKEIAGVKLDDIQKERQELRNAWNKAHGFPIDE